DRRARGESPPAPAPSAIVVAAHSRAAIGLLRELVSVALSLSPGDVMTMARVHCHAADLGRTVEPKGHEKFMQEARMVVVAGILGVELPVAADTLAVIAEDRDRPIE